MHKVISRSKYHELKPTRSGFTIVELLVVIVVIGILAAITIVSYAGVTQRATVASLQSDLANASQQLKMYQVDNSAYPNSVTDCPTPAAGNTCLKVSPSTTYLYSANNNSNPQTFSLYATKNTTRYNITDDSNPTVANQVAATGGTVTDIGGYRIHTFTTVGISTFNVASGGNVEVLVVGGGGSGGASGGGAGGLVYDSNTAVDVASYNVIVGDGGASWDVLGGATGGYHGGSSSINVPGVATANGGQGGFGWDYQPSTTMNIWGSGAGAPQSSSGPYVNSGYTLGQGYPGGPDPDMNSSPYPSGGGGGAGGPGVKAGGPTSLNNVNGNGGVGLDMSPSFGTSVGENGWFGGGAAGSCHLTGCIAAIGGNGGGGDIGVGCVSGGAGMTNTGGAGAGGMNCAGSLSGSGGSGIVIIRYPY